MMCFSLFVSLATKCFNALFWKVLGIRGGQAEGSRVYAGAAPDYPSTRICSARVLHRVCVCVSV